MRESFLIRFLAFVFRIINRFVPWHKIPFGLFIFAKLSPRLWNLPALRYDLRRYNLHDTSGLPSRPRPPNFTFFTPPNNPGLEPCDPFQPPASFNQEDLGFRRGDGSYNDLQSPRMGASCTRFGRNFPLDVLQEDWPQDPLGGPNPRDISNRVLARDSFKPAESLNLLAAVWIQFMVHDWVRHTNDLNPQYRRTIDLRGDDLWVRNQWATNKQMEVERTLPDPTRPPGCQAGPPTFLNENTAWWDSSALYGSDRTTQQQLRSHTDGKLRMEQNDTRLPDSPQLPGQDLTGFMFGWWAGLSLLHTLFAREHNAICDMLQARYPSWNDDRLFNTARLITAALIAKIHTVEWTPAILGQPVLKIGMDANWWGVLGEQFRRKVGRISESEELSGIPGSVQNHHGVPFSLTEEFVSVYRLHPLIPDQYRFHSLHRPEYTPCVTVNGKPRVISTFDDIEGQSSRRAIDTIGMEDFFYSFGLAHPGAVTLGNYPLFLRQYIPPGHPYKLRMDLASIDIFRDRERSIPRYNRFRELLRMPRVKSFDELNPQWAKALSDLYNGDIDQLDPMVGLFAEEPPEGFGISDTAFRIFIVMASRRLESDRFFTTDYRADVYTQAGLDWINDNGFESVLLRHYPALGPAVHGLANPFHPWRNVHEPVGV